MCSGKDFWHRERIFVRQQGFPKRVALCGVYFDGVCGGFMSAVFRVAWRAMTILFGSLVMAITRLLDYIAPLRVSLAIP